MAKREILNGSKTRLRLFEGGIKMDESLPKHKEYKEFLEKKNLLDEVKRKGMSQLDMTQADLDLLNIEVQASNVNSLPPIIWSGSNGMDDMVVPRKGIPDYETLKKMFLDDTSLDSCKILVTAYMKDIMEKNRWDSSNSFVFNDQSATLNDNKIVNGSKESFWDRLKKILHPEEEHPDPEVVEEFDVIAFFNRVKLETEDKQKTYVNRLKDLVTCIGYCDTTGQVALKESLFEQLTINKYESVLWANNMYKAISEEKIIEFIKGSDKGIALDYISNFTRVIPPSVIKNKIEADKLGVFDNYVILHYDPESKSYMQTEEEKRKEVEKKKDPILFGVIMGSDKLYFIDDWTDEYCDLTFETITEKLGAEVVANDFIKETIQL